MIAAHRAHGQPLTVALARMPDTGRFGRVSLDATGVVTAFAEKTSRGCGLVNAGV
jgi:NDP-sugar pyrophosphorylase family protein